MKNFAAVLFLLVASKGFAAPQCSVEEGFPGFYVCHIYWV